MLLPPGQNIVELIMNATILTAVWGIIMMFGGVFIKSKSAPKYLAIAGLILILIANCFELRSGEPFFHIDVKDMLHFNSFNLTFITVALGCTLFFFLLNGRDIEKLAPM